MGPRVQREVSTGSLWALVREVLAHRSDPGAGLLTIEKGIELLRDREITSLEAQAERVFRRRVAASIRPGARAIVRAHRDAGHTLVLASAATRFQAEPVARDLGIDHLLTTAIEVRDGKATGKVRGTPRWGKEKARAVIDFSEAQGIDRGVSFAYGNGVEDRSFLEAVGRPVAVRPDAGLSAFARAVGIPILDLANPPAPGLRAVAGTLTAIGAFNAGIVGTLTAAAVLGKRVAFGRGLATTADAALAAGGVRLRVHGREHIEAARPAVFIFNHQSSLDPLIVASIVRRDFTGVGKQEVARDPRSWAMRFLDLALIDRGDSERARASVAALVARIHAGESVLIAPEGTRMPTPTLGRFKRGAFHLAHDAQVPLVPIVIRNAGELWPPGTPLMMPGIIDVCILPPVPTNGWSREDIGEKADEVRTMFAATLGHWPKTAPESMRQRSAGS